MVTPTRYALRRPVKNADGTTRRDPDTGKTMSEPTGVVVWRARYKGPDGKEHTRHFPMNKKRDAQRWLDEQTAATVTGQFVNPRAGNVTWTTWTAEWVERQVWADGTVEAAQTALQSVPWGDKTLNSILTVDVDTWIKRETQRGLAASTIRTRLNYIQMVFRGAVREKIIATSPAVDAKPPRVRKAEAAMEILTAEQVSAVLEVAGHFRGFVEVCVYAGLRLGEAAGLQIADVNFLGRVINVRRQIQGSSLASTKPVPPKFGSERAIDVPSDLTAALSAHIKDTRISDPGEYLFRTPLGHLYQRNNAGEEWRKIRTRVGLPDTVTLHTLRHTYASNLIAAGCDVVTVQRALGHSTPSITLNVYGHLWPTAGDRTRAAAASFMESVASFADSPRTQNRKPQVGG
ncbi:tyrosine-type recombinase/integrase [Microbacterium sp. ZW T5_56]|uniref:tyrosine-type recombinase/integrase n=1 Tax=Microbacterium sp. ZW T5_56 TaxID=3378081 RepID=UPI003853DFD3